MKSMQYHMDDYLFTPKIYYIIIKDCFNDVVITM